MDCWHIRNIYNYKLGKWSYYPHNIHCYNYIMTAPLYLLHMLNNLLEFPYMTNIFYCILYRCRRLNNIPNHSKNKVLIINGFDLVGIKCRSSNYSMLDMNYHIINKYCLRNSNLHHKTGR